MKKQRVRPQAQPLLYDSHLVGHINSLTHSHYYSRYTWRQDLHLLSPPMVPAEVEQVFHRNEENKKATEKMKLLRLILAERMRLNSKETVNQQPVADYKDREKMQEQLKEEEIDRLLMSASRWREEPTRHKQRLSIKSRVPLHMMTSATMGTLPLNRPGTAQPRNTDFLKYASNPRFKDLLSLVQSKNPNSVLLGGDGKRKQRPSSSRYLE